MAMAYMHCTVSSDAEMVAAGVAVAARAARSSRTMTSDHDSPSRHNVRAAAANGMQS